MALHAGIRQSLVIFSSMRALNSYSFQFKNKQIISSYRFKHGNSNGSSHKRSRQEINWKLACGLSTAIGLAPIALNSSLHKKHVLAEEEDKQNNDQEIMGKDIR